MKRFLLVLALAAGLTPVFAQTRDWVTTWATALQIAEPHNRPPEPGLAGNSLRQIVQVSIGGKDLQLEPVQRGSDGHPGRGNRRGQDHGRYA